MADVIRKTLPVEIKEIADRVVEFIGSTETQDRDREIILAKGWDLKNFRKNPVFLFAHRYDQPPIGKALKVKVEDGALKFQIEFADQETYPFADTIYRLYKGGFMRATSVGFVPIEWRDNDEDDEDEKSPRRIYTKQELLELSAVPVPSNPNALVQARNEGIITTKDFDLLTKPEETDRYFRIPVSGEEGKHEGHRIRTIDISKDKGIKALYCGECKINITYLFDKDPKYGWTMEKAKQWVKEHEKPKAPADDGISQAAIADELDYCLNIIQRQALDKDNLQLAEKLALSICRLNGVGIKLMDANDDVNTKVGAVLNARNKRNLIEAQGLIQQVLDSAEPATESTGLPAESLSQEVIAQAVVEAMKRYIQI